MKHNRSLQHYLTNLSNYHRKWNSDGISYRWRQNEQPFKVGQKTADNTCRISYTH